MNKTLKKGEEKAKVLTISYKRSIQYSLSTPVASYPLNVPSILPVLCSSPRVPKLYSTMGWYTNLLKTQMPGLHSQTLI